MKALVSFVAVLGVVGAAQAQDAPVSEMTVDDFVAVLTPEQQPLTRSATTRGVTPSVAMDVNFEFASARLTPEAEGLLSNLALALQTPALAAENFQLAGHTDAVGSHEANDRLSLQRATAVRDYLVSEYELDPERLEVVGYGKRHLLIEDAPEDGRNRRVEVSVMAD